MENSIVENDPMMNDIPFLERELGVFNGQHHFLHLAKIEHQDLMNPEKADKYANLIADLMYNQFKVIYHEGFSGYVSPPSQNPDSVFHFCMAIESEKQDLFVYFYKPQFFQYEKRHYPELVELHEFGRATMMWWPTQNHDIAGVLKWESEIALSVNTFITLDDLVKHFEKYGVDRYSFMNRIHKNQKGKYLNAVSDE